MNDLANQQAISLGNARNQAVRDLNESIRQHNTDIANSISSIKDQIKTTDTIRQAKDTAQGLWTGASMPSKIKAYQDYVASKKSSNPTTQSENSTIENAQNNAPQDDATTPEQNPTDPPREPVAEGSPTGESIGEEAEASTSRLTNGLRKTGAFSDETLDTLQKGGTKLGEGAGALGALAIGGLDVYDDIKSGGLAGNNNWEKASNFLQIGGSIADIVGTAYPPAKLIGGVLDLTAGALDTIGEAKDDTADKKEDAVQKSETETQVAQPQAIAQTL